MENYKSAIKMMASKIDPVVSRDGRSYPFVGEKGVRRHLEGNPLCRILNAVVMFHLQTGLEQAAQETTDKNRRGLMSSHAKVTSRLCEQFLLGIEMDDSTTHRVDGQLITGDLNYLAHVGGRYAKQLSVCLRGLAISEEPELGVTAGMFSVK